LTEEYTVRLIIPEEQMSVLLRICDLLELEVELSNKVLKLIRTVTSPQEEQELEVSLDG